jgi:hypothetical protein
MKRVPDVLWPFQESSIIEAVEKQLQGTSSASSQPSLTPQMGKKPQMGTHVSQQHQQQQIEQQAITPLSGEFFAVFRFEAATNLTFFRFLVKVEHVLVDGKVKLGRANAADDQQARKTSSSSTKAHQVRNPYWIS